MNAFIYINDVIHDVISVFYIKNIVKCPQICTIIKTNADKMFIYTYGWVFKKTNATLITGNQFPGPFLLIIWHFNVFFRKAKNWPKTYRKKWHLVILSLEYYKRWI